MFRTQKSEMTVDGHQFKLAVHVDQEIVLFTLILFAIRQTKISLFNVMYDFSPCRSFSDENI